MQYHSLKVKVCIEQLKTSARGLSDKEALNRLKKYGKNELIEEKQISKLAIFFSQFNNALAIILIIAGLLSLLLREFVDAGVIFGAVAINTIIGFFQENKANQAITKLKTLVERKTVVIRDGHEIAINSSLVTRGDIILIRAGNRIPADARLIEALDLQVNEASLTGESIPSRKHNEAIPKGAALADRDNMVYAGTMVVHGVGSAVVTDIGIGTELGKIAEMVRGTKEEDTPLQLRLAQFGRLLGVLSALVCVSVVLVGIFQGREIKEMVITGIAVAVASIPEGLSMAVTFILALGMQRILKKKALTRKLVAAETLGSITVICTDKTGTLTEGKMHVAHIVVGEKEFEMDTLGSRQEKDEAMVVSLTLQIGMMCNNATIENPDDELSSWRFIGSPTESALLSAAIQSGLNKQKLLKIEPQIDEVPFDSEKKYMLSLHESERGGYVLYEKGAPERLLDKSKSYYHHGKEVSLTDVARAHLNKTYENLTGRGLRVIGLAVRHLKTKEEFKRGHVNWEELDKDLTFVGFIAITDPLRREARETIITCQEAGIRPVLITGDHKLTAQTIAREVGLDVKAENIITGEKLDRVSDEELRKIVKKIDIYARVSPHHKLRIVKALQDRGEVVAMTGDGINDSPALKAADIGISLGTGTDIAKETSNLVLLDDNFQTIIEAIREGRVIFKNIRKVITYLISDAFAEVILIVGSIIMNMPLALIPAQILWVNILNDGLPDFSLAFEKGDKNTMKEKPIQKKEPLLSSEMKMIIFPVGIARSLITFAVFIVLFNKFDDLDYVRTVIFAILATSSLLSIFSIRDFNCPIWRKNPFSNKYLIAAVSASFSLLLLGIYWGPLQYVLDTVALGPLSWLLVFGVSFIGIFMIELVKFYYTDQRVKY